MIIISFFRNKVTKIYLTIIIILLVAISLLFGSVSYLNKLYNEAYQKGSLFYIESVKDIYSDLSKSNDIVNLNEVIKFDYDGELIDKYYLFEYEADDHILSYEDKSNKYQLKDNEVVLSIFGTSLKEDEKQRFDFYKNKEITFKYNNTDIVLKIKDIEFSNHGSITISSPLFNKLKESLKDYSYTLSFATEKIAENHESIWNKEKELASEDDLFSSNQLKKNKKYVEYASYVCIFIFVIVIIVVNKNVISDLNDNMKMELKIGYTNNQIKFNLFKRLSLLHILSYVVSLVITFIISSILLIVWNINIDYNFIINTLVLTSIILLSDILLSLILKIKNT